LDIIEIASSILKENALCDNCLGRQFAMLGHGLTNKKRGRTLKLACVLKGSMLEKEGKDQGTEILFSVAINGYSKVAISTLETLGFIIEKKDAYCCICRDAFNDLEGIARQAVDRIAEYEYDTFLVGIKVEVDIEDKEDELRSRFGIRWGESIRNEFSREIGKKVMEITSKKVNFKRPDILIEINPLQKKINFEVNSIFIKGRYRKLVRGIPQSEWFCRECKGMGCQRCKGTGKMYPDSIEELIAAPLLQVSKGERTKLHAAGREDVDVRMLGLGRPFIVEVKKPRVRTIELEGLKQTINQGSDGKIEVDNLKVSSKEEVRKLKLGEKADKIYRAIVKFAKELNAEDVNRIEGLANTPINQVTPLRVSHRRAIKTRKKYLYGIKLKKFKQNIYEMLIRCEGGLYIKELISGDNGLTRPSIREISGISTKCIELDVIGVELEGF